ncbi:hypothetical protein WA026_009908 [Henosepilachna vigintioctopunctata]|uniref:Uncharacterized protein n=1 Tax=Henosepilachna vigintioctopunctata TaxID=420089 RepID=A0AAW1TR93_9CUCU
MYPGIERRARAFLKGRYVLRTPRAIIFELFTWISSSPSRTSEAIVSKTQSTTFPAYCDIVAETRISFGKFIFKFVMTSTGDMFLNGGGRTQSIYQQPSTGEKHVLFYPTSPAPSATSDEKRSWTQGSSGQNVQVSPVVEK